MHDPDAKIAQGERDYVYPLRRPGVEVTCIEGVLGDVMLVNGAPWPVAVVSATRHTDRGWPTRPTPAATISRATG